MLCGNHPLRTTGSSDSQVPYDEQLAQAAQQSQSAPQTPKPQLSKAQRQAAARAAAAKSKHKLWGPSHSFDSDSDDDNDDDDDLELNPNNSASCNKYASNLGVQGGFGCGNGAGAPGSTWWETMGKAWTELNATAMMSVVRPSTASHAKTAANHNKRRSRNGSQQSPPPQLMEVVQEEEEDGHESDTDPSTQEDSNGHSDSHSHTKGPSATPNTSTTTDSTTSVSRNEVNTSRDASKKHARSSLASPSSNNDAPKPNNTARAASKVDEWTDIIFSANACVGSPCSAHDLEEIFGRQQQQQQQQYSSKTGNACGLGIAPLTFDFGVEDDDHVVVGPSKQKQQQQSRSAQASSPPPPPPPQRTFSEDSTPAERRRQRNQVRRQRHEQAVIQTSLSQAQSSMAPHEDFEVTSQQDVLVTQPTTTAVLQQQSLLPPPLADEDDDGNIPNDTFLRFPPLQQQSSQQLPQAPVPMETLFVKEDEAQALERSISELTMRSSYQPPATTSTAHAPPEQRRMAYYAVGRHHRLAGPRNGGNRRCYFTGKLIFGGAPFYAGIVQQGLRTLVVFCLPSALGMPQNLPGYSSVVASSSSSHTHKRQGSGMSSLGGGLLQRSRRTLSSAASISTKKSLLSKSSLVSGARSKLSSTIHLDDMSLSIEGDIDPNWNLDKDYLLRVLPEPSDDAVLTEMNQRYPEQFETLPVQVRHPKCWRIYVKFCFFSGLPIAEGELHYQVHPALALELYGEDIVLSHDVMEAVNGASSADILKLPNQKTFRYLKKHYQQQSAKLPEIVFKRTSWEQVRPEV